MEPIGAKIAALRKRKGLTQEKLSDLSKINLRTLQRIEKGTSEPRGETLLQLCRALEVKMEDLLQDGKKDNLLFLKYFHLSVITCLFFPLGNVILPLVLWLTNRDKVTGLQEQGLQVLNYQIVWSLLFYFFFILWFVFTIHHWNHSFLFLYLMSGLYLLNIVYPLMVYSSVSKGIVRKFYFNPVQFIK